MTEPRDISECQTFGSAACSTEAIGTRGAGLAWHNMRDRVSAVFPSITDLDLRQHNVMVSGSPNHRRIAKHLGCSAFSAWW